MILTVHQPEHMPWLGFFDKVWQADVVVLLDNVPFRKNYFQNRNKIRTQQGWTWLTVPVLAKGMSSQLIQEVQINRAVDWQNKHWKSFTQSYSKAPFFPKYSNFLKQIYDKQWAYLADLNEEIIGHMIHKLGIKVKTIRASILGVTGRKTDLLIQICQKLNADIYLSGISGKDYIEESKFTEQGISVIYHEFYHPIYKQLYEPFIPCMSIIDLLVNHGDKSLDILKGIGVARMDRLFE
ncbi:WbqC family protein [Chloroflexota bacterium]